MVNSTANIEIPKNQIGSISQNVQFEDISTLSIRLRVAQYLGTGNSYRVTVYVYAGNTLLKSYTGAFMRNFVTISADCSKIKGEQTLKISFKPINSDNNYNNHGIIYLDYIRPGNQFTSSITANNCNFINCTATAGAAFYGGNSQFTNCNFIDCSANNGGAIYAYDPVTVTKSKFINNTADDYGAVAATSTTGNIFTNSIFVGNSGHDSSTGLFYSSNSATSYTLNNNWWGHNSTNKDNFESLVTRPAKSTLTSWYYLGTETNNTYNVLWRNEQDTQVRYTFKSTGSSGIITTLPSITLSNIQVFNGIVLIVLV